MLHKLFTPMMFRVADRFYQRFIQEAKEARLVQQRTLQQILTLNRETEFGRKYNFSGIRSELDFKKSVPLSAYEDYSEAIQRMAQKEPDILTTEPVIYFGQTSGTTGRQKLIPITPNVLRTASRYMGMLPLAILRRHFKGRFGSGWGLNLMNMAVSGFTEGGIPISTGTSGGMRSIKFMIPYFWTSPLEIIEPDGQVDALYLHLLFALREKNLLYITAPFISSILDLCRRLERDWPKLTADLAAGTIDPEIMITPRVKAALLAKLRPDPVRSRELEREFQHGFPNILARIWPNLLFIWSVAGGSFQVYEEKLRPYRGSLPVYSGIYAATECASIGISLDLDRPAYVITPGGAYFEFIPLADSAPLEPVGLDQLTPGRNYEVVVTSFNGLYRYRMGDVVKVTGYFHQSPEIEFLYRRNQLLNLAGEKTSEQAAYSGICATFQRLGYEWVDFTVSPDIDSFPGKYVFFVEVKEPLFSNDMEEIQQILDQELCQANPAYGRSRANGKIGRAGLQLLELETFHELKKRLIARGASANQLKIPRVIWDQNLLEFLQSRLSRPILEDDDVTDEG